MPDDTVTDDDVKVYNEAKEFIARFLVDTMLVRGASPEQSADRYAAELLKRMATRNPPLLIALGERK